jgi:hypothetical protein
MESPITTCILLEPIPWGETIVTRQARFASTEWRIYAAVAIAVGAFLLLLLLAGVAAASLS